MKTIALLLAVAAVTRASSDRCPNTSNCPNEVSRQAWGGQYPKETTDFPCLPDLVVIIHSETSECFDNSFCCVQLRFMQNLHMEKWGWDDIGYNFAVGGDGVVYKGRGWNHVGAHSSGYNSESISIALIGNFNDHLPTDAALKAVRELIACGVAKGKIARDYKLVGHRQVSNTNSPGNALFSEIQTWPRWTSSLSN